MNNLKLHFTILISLLFVFNACKKEKLESYKRGTVVDYEGNTYETVKIGEQWWMAENLNSTKYADGTEIPHVGSNNTWEDLGENDRAYCYSHNLGSMSEKKYGALYNFAAATNNEYTTISQIQGVCPTGWHLPSDDEWQTLEEYLGMPINELGSFYSSRGTNQGSQLAGGKELWEGEVLISDPEFNTSGFNGKPGGNRVDWGSYFHEGTSANWWSSTLLGNSEVIFRHLNSSNPGVGRGYIPMNFGFSVRCIKD